MAAAGVNPQIDEVYEYPLLGLQVRIDHFDPRPGVVWVERLDDHYVFPMAIEYLGRLLEPVRNSVPPNAPTNRGGRRRSKRHTKKSKKAKKSRKAKKTRRA